MLQHMYAQGSSGRARWGLSRLGGLHVLWCSSMYTGSPPQHTHTGHRVVEITLCCRPALPQQSMCHTEQLQHCSSVAGVAAPTCACVLLGPPTHPSSRRSGCSSQRQCTGAAHAPVNQSVTPHASLHMHNQGAAAPTPSHTVGHKGEAHAPRAMLAAWLPPFPSRVLICTCEPRRRTCW